MYLIQALVLAVVWIQGVCAFHPYVPAYKCVMDGDCGDSKISADGLLESRDTFSLKLIQRVPMIDLPRRVLARRSAAKLKRKYAHANGLEKRKNSYSVMQASTPTQSYSTGIDQDGSDFSYFAAVTVGSNNTPLYMLLDTGAGTSWVMGTDCTSTACLAHNTFGSANSTTLKQTSSTFSIAYGSGKVAGAIYIDTLTIAGMTLNMHLGIANETSNDFNNFPFDGILGLSNSKTDATSFLGTLTTSNVLKANVFGVAINRAKDGTNTGEINFGAPDTSKYSGSLAYFPVSDSAGGDWAISLTSVGNGSSSSPVAAKLGYVDTGTTYIFTSPADAATFHAMFPGAKTSDGDTYTVPCTTTADATFTFGTTTFKISSKDWVSPPVNGVCTSNIFGQDIVPGGWLFGDTFIKNVYVLFDTDQDRLGLAQRIVTTATTTSSSSTSTGTSSSSFLSSSSVAAGTTTSPSSSSTATISDGKTTGTSAGSSGSATTTNSGTTVTGMPSTGMDGHQTSSSGNTAAAETTSSSATASATPTHSLATRPNSNLLMAALAVLVIVGLIY